MTQFMDKLNGCIGFYEENREQFVNDHHQKFVVIFDKRVIGIYDDEADAHKTGRAVAGGDAFLLRQCLTSEEGEANKPVFRSRVA